MSAETHRWIRGLAIVVAILSIVLAVSQRSRNAQPGMPAAPETQVAVLAPAPAAGSIPPLFAPREGTEGEGAGLIDGAAGPPEMIGIAGRLPDDVEVLIRLPDGRTDALRRGESAGGWTLNSATVDRAVFERAGVRSVVLLQAP